MKATEPNKTLVDNALRSRQSQSLCVKLRLMCKMEHSCERGPACGVFC